ncbi:cation transporter [archaeon CG10_big_fil_rev_8_21_14_0_10_43_11]|nr:MAG: cation transporter [archaeon CG10_big_fil_rev_8_21_14_0_10_43_11]
MPHSHDEPGVSGVYWALIITFSVFTLELVGGFLTNSLSLASDALHVFLDAFSLVLVISAITVSCRIPSKTITFGFHRVEVIVALINGSFLTGASAYIFVEAIQRIVNPEPVLSLHVLGIALIGLVANVFVLKKFNFHEDDLNVQSAYLHVLSDTITSVGVILGAALIWLTGAYWVDGLLGAVIGVFILIQAVRLINRSMHVLLQGTPVDVDVDALIATMKKQKGVTDVHHVHVWTLCSRINVLSAHVVVSFDSIQKSEELNDALKQKLAKYHIGYTTLQFESTRKSGAPLVHLTHAKKRF